MNSFLILNQSKERRGGVPEDMLGCSPSGKQKTPWRLLFDMDLGCYHAVVLLCVVGWQYAIRKNG